MERQDIEKIFSATVEVVENLQSLKRLRELEAPSIIIEGSEKMLARRAARLEVLGGSNAEIRKVAEKFVETKKAREKEVDASWLGTLIDVVEHLRMFHIGDTTNPAEKPFGDEMLDGDWKNFRFAIESGKLVEALDALRLILVNVRWNMIRLDLPVVTLPAGIESYRKAE